MQQEWESLAERASTETDSAKLSKLIEELCAALDARYSKPVNVDIAVLVRERPALRG
jgi:hypothetical protein